jgi:hypothetical protein
MTGYKGSEIVNELTGANRLRAHQGRNANKKYKKEFFDHSALLSDTESN